MGTTWSYYTSDALTIPWDIQAIPRIYADVGWKQSESHTPTKSNCLTAFYLPCSDGTSTVGKYTGGLRDDVRMPFSVLNRAKFFSLWHGRSFKNSLIDWNINENKPKQTLTISGNKTLAIEICSQSKRNFHCEFHYEIRHDIRIFLVCFVQTHVLLVYIRRKSKLLTILLCWFIGLLVHRRILQLER